MLDVFVDKKNHKFDSETSSLLFENKFRNMIIITF